MLKRHNTQHLKQIESEAEPRLEADSGLPALRDPNEHPRVSRLTDFALLERGTLEARQGPASPVSLRSPARRGARRPPSSAADGPGARAAPHPGETAVS